MTCCPGRQVSSHKLHPPTTNYQMKLPSFIPVLLVSLITSWLPAQSGAAGDAAGSELRDSYRLRPQDQIELQSYVQPILDENSVVNVTIGRDGAAFFPLIKSVFLEGLTTSEASEKLRQLYEADYLVAPRFGVRVVEYAQEFVEVTGQVVSPGSLPIPRQGNLNLSTAITNAGGLTTLADKKRIELNRAKGGGEIFTLEEVLGEAGKTTILASGDQVVVHKNRHANSLVSVQGEVVSPGDVAIPKDGRLLFSTALATARGPGPEADLTKIELIRADGGERRTYSHESIKNGSAKNIVLRGGDRIIVYKSPFVGETVSVEGEVKEGGFIPFPLDGKLKLRDAITLAGGWSELANRKVILEREGFGAKSYDLDDLAKRKLVIWLEPDDRVTAKRRLF